MFAATFAFVLVVVHVAAEIPSYIHVCSRRDPNLQECVLNSVENLKEKLCQGIPELEVVPLQPLIVNRTILADRIALVTMENASISGLCNWKTNFSHLDLKKYHFDVDLTFERIILNGTISRDYRDSDLPPSLNYRQQSIFLTTDNTSALVSIDMQVMIKDGVKYLYLSKIALILYIEGYEIEVGVNMNEDSQALQQVDKAYIEHILFHHWAIKPFIGNILTQYILDSGNKIVKHFAYDELFPDRS